MRVLFAVAVSSLLALPGAASAQCPGVAVALAADSTVTPACVPFVPIGVIEPAGGFVGGCDRPVALTGDPASAVLLECPAGCPGPCRGKDLSCTIANGCPCFAAPGTWLRVMQGNRAGAIVSGIEERFGRDTDRRDGLCVDGYHGVGERLVVLPVVGLDSGHGPARLLRYALFFLREQPSNHTDHVVSAEFVRYLPTTR